VTRNAGKSKQAFIKVMEISKEQKSSKHDKLIRQLILPWNRCAQ
jgi:hypothetical protein